MPVLTLAVLLGQSGAGRVALAQAAAVTGQALTVQVTASGGGQVTVNQPVIFNATATTPNTGQTIVGFTFNFGDQSSPAFVPATATGASGTATTTHTYATTMSGAFLVTVTAVDSSNASGTATTSVTVKVSGQQPTVTLTPTSLTVQAGQTVTLAQVPATGVATCTGLTICYAVTTPNTGATVRQLGVNFGEGSTAVASPFMTITAGSTATHTYLTPGTYTISVIAQDSTGLFGQALATVTVSAPPVVGRPLTNVLIVNPPTTGAVGQPLTFTAATAVTPNTNATIATTGYVWAFGDGGVALGQSVTHPYATPGTFPVTLTVTDSTGASATTSTSVTITGAATPTPTPVPTATPGLTVTYPAGWNIVAGPAGTIITGNSGPLYAFKPGDTNYETIASGTPLQAGVGYWAFFPQAATVTIPLSGPQSINVTMPRQFIMVGNAGNTQATVTATPTGGTGATYYFTWSPSANTYTPSTTPITLSPGQGAWVAIDAPNGGTVTITNQ